MARPFFAAGAMAYVGNESASYINYFGVSAVSFFGGLFGNASSAADAFTQVPFKTAGEYFRSLGPEVVKQVKELFGVQPLGSKLMLLRGDDRVRYPCEPSPPGLIDTIPLSAGPSAHAVGKVKLESNLHYRLEVTGMTHRQLGPDFSDFDAMYCFNSSSDNPNFCKPGHPFPTLTELFFATQIDDETPATLKNALDFTNTSVRPDFDGNHHYTFHFNGTGGKVWVETWPQFDPGTTESLTGSFAIQIFRE